jgi:hypothetical protein
MQEVREALDKGQKSKASKLLRELAGGTDAGEYYLEARDLLESLEASKERKYTAADLKDPDFVRRAMALEWFAVQYPKVKFEKEAAPLLADADAAVRMRAVAYVALARPEAVLERAAALMADPSDQVKVATMAVLKDHGSTELVTETLCDAWRGLDAGKVPSQNPNVLRMGLAAVLGEKGGVEAIDVMRAKAADGDPNNASTRAAVEAIGKIGGRTRSRAAADALLEAFPPAPTAEQMKDKGWQDRLARLADSVHGALIEATGIKSVTRSDPWDEKGRARTLADWKKALGR